jgi:murein DD-endopeptidase MepM/ murein hydrolase activator NlpD
VVNVFDAPDGPYARGHRGADLLGRAGQPVLAVGDGTVAYAGNVGGIGVISIDTSAGRVTYQPVLAQVRRGEDVAAGTVLGRLATTGGHCLPQVCLHLGLIVAGDYRDPLSLLGGAAVRLLPVDGPLVPGFGTATSPAGAVRGPEARPAGVDALAVGARLGVGRW